jgi:hypothetical protein
LVLIMICGSHTDTVVMRSRRSRMVVELLTAYSHSPQAGDLWICHAVALTSPVLL